MLEAIHLSKHYGKYTALEDLNLSISSGHIFCLLGPNGAGKTTTLHLFLGLISPSQGQVRIDGETPGPKASVAYIPEVVQLYGNLSGVDNLDLFCRFSGARYSKGDLRQFLSTAGLSEDAHNRLLSTYSKGMRQKVAIAIALAKDAHCIFMDEPSSGLDPQAMQEFSAICKQLASLDKTLFIATHDVFQAATLGTHFGIMKDGKLLQTLENKNLTATQLQETYLTQTSDETP